MPDPAVPMRYDSAGEARVVARASIVERSSWSLFDFANTIFSMNVTTLYFGVWLVNDLRASNITYAAGNAISSVLVILTVPFLGALSDARRRRKRWVVGFTLLSCAACAAIGVLGQTTVPLVGQELIDATAVAPEWRSTIGDVKWVLLAFIVANFAYQSALPFYNAMLPELVPAEEQGRMSGIGVGIGYVGSIVGVLLVIPFFTGGLPVLGPLSDGVMSVLRSLPYTSHGGRVSVFVPTAILFLFFAIPLILICRDHDPVKERVTINFRGTIERVVNTLRDGRNRPGALRFILASFIYQDAVGTIIGFMTLYAVRAVGFERGSETTLFLVLTIPAIFGSFFYGWLTDRIGPKRSLRATLLVWVVLLIGMVAAPSKGTFWIVGFAIGLNYGGVNAVERPMLLSLVPDTKAGQYFSLMLLSARAAAIVGPLVWSVTVDSLEGPLGTSLAYRVAVLTVTLYFLVAWWLLRSVPDRRPGTAVEATA